MVDLEDAFLKKNVPGRYSTWTEDKDDIRRNDDEDVSSDSEDDEYYFQGLPSNNNDNASKQSSAPLQPSTSASGPTLRSSGNTGVKGVLADYREAQQAEQLRKEEDRLDRLEALHRATNPAISNRLPNDNNNNANAINNRDGDESESDDDFDDGDDEFLKQFRNQRLAQLQSQSQSMQQSSQNQQQQLPTFSTLSTLTPDQYVTLVDSIHPQAHLIVHLYESSIHQCQMLQSTLEKLATSSGDMDYAKFVTVNALEANPTLDTICLPAVLIYRGGRLIHNLVRFTDELVGGNGWSSRGRGSGGGFGVEEVRELLEKTLSC